MMPEISVSIGPASTTMPSATAAPRRRPSMRDATCTPAGATGSRRGATTTTRSSSGASSGSRTATRGGIGGTRFARGALCVTIGGCSFTHAGSGVGVGAGVGATATGGAGFGAASVARSVIVTSSCEPGCPSTVISCVASPGWRARTRCVPPSTRDCMRPATGIHAPSSIATSAPAGAMSITSTHSFLSRSRRSFFTSGFASAPVSSRYCAYVLAASASRPMSRNVDPMSSRIFGLGYAS